MADKRRTKLRISYNAPVILTFALLSFAALIADWLTHGWTNTHLFMVYRASMRDPLSYVRFFGHVLGHTSFSHFFGNISLLLVIGPVAEEKYGSRNLLASILLTAVVSSALQWIFFPTTALLGASGVVFMLILLSAFTNIKSGSIPLTLVLVAVMYFGQEIAAALTQSDNISQLAHIAGGGCGILCGTMLNRPAKK